MRIIEGLKSKKPFITKVNDLAERNHKMAYHMSVTGSEFDKPVNKIKQNMDSIQDTLRNIEEITMKIAYKNSTTKVEIKLPSGKAVTKTISEWICRRDTTLPLEISAVELLLKTPVNMANGFVEDKKGELTPNRIVRNFDFDAMNDMLGYLKEERSAIDSALEIVNATHELE